ncbi:3079_t:CDS:2, partial [Racocetra persica]
MSDIDDNENGEGNRPTDQSIITLEKESRKKSSKDTRKNKLSSKKVKTKDGNVSILKKLIKKLKSPSSSTSNTTSQAESITSPSEDKIQRLKTRTLEIDGQPVNLFDLDKNSKLIPMLQSLYSREIVVAEIVRQLAKWGVTSSQGRFDFDVGCGRMIRAPDIAYTPKEIYRSLNENQNWSFRGEPFTPVFVVEIGNISSYSKFEKLDRKFKDIYFAEGHLCNWDDILPRFTLEIWKIEHAIFQRESVSPEPTENNTLHNCPYCSKTLTSVYDMMKYIEKNSKSELDLLKQENARLMAKIKELEQIAKEKDKLEVRIVELEQITKLSQTENAKLKVEIEKLNRFVKNIEKQNRTVTNDLKSPKHFISLPIKNCENAQITDKSETQDFVSSSSHQEVTSEQIDNTISDIYYLNGTCFGESESLEEKTKTSSLHNAKTVTKCHDQNHTIDNFDTTSEMLESDNQIIEGLIQEITSNQTQSIVLPEINTNNGKIEISKSCIQDMIPDSVQ